MKRVLIIIVFITVITVIASYKTVNAQQVTLSINPPITELLVKPGKTLLIGYTIGNIGDPTTLQVKVRSFTPLGDYGESIIDNELITPIRFSLDNTDMQFETPFFMKQGDVVQALLRIRIPEGVPEGDYYFHFLAVTQPVPAIGGATNSLAQAIIGSNLLLTVTQKGRTEIKGNIALFSFKPDYILRLFGKEYNIVESLNKVPITLIVQNQGKNLIKPEGTITLTGSLGDKRSYALLSQNVLASSRRLIKVENMTDIDPQLTLQLSGNFIGRYDLRADVNFGVGSNTTSSITSFIGVPIKLGGSLIMVAIISVMIIISFKKKKSE